MPRALRCRAARTLAAAFVLWSPAAAQAQGWEGFGGSEGPGAINPEGHNAYYGIGLARDAEGHPAIAWPATCATTGPGGRVQAIFLRMWNGAAWVEVGGSATGEGVCSGVAGIAAIEPSLALDSQGRPVVAWLNYESGDVGRFCVRRWDGAGWTNYGSSIAVGDPHAGHNGESQIIRPWLALDSDDNPIITFNRTWYTNACSLYVLRWDPDLASWIGMDGSVSGLVAEASAAGDCQVPILKLGSQDRPFVAWQGLGSGAEQIYLLRWDGEAWMALGESAAGSGLSGMPLVTDGRPDMAIDADDRPAVTWGAWTGGTKQVMLKQWNGDAWVELGGSASGGGISYGLFRSHKPAVALDAEGRPMVAWQDWDGEFRQRVYFSRWNGTWWDDLGGSNYDQGVSQNGTTSSSPFLIPSSTGRPMVAWNQYTNLNGTGETLCLAQWTGAMEIPPDGTPGPTGGNSRQNLGSSQVSKNRCGGSAAGAGALVLLAGLALAAAVRR